jgi:hypothetical protein
MKALLAVATADYSIPFEIKGLDDGTNNPANGTGSLPARELDWDGGAEALR